MRARGINMRSMHNTHVQSTIKILSVETIQKESPNVDTGAKHQSFGVSVQRFSCFLLYCVIDLVTFGLRSAFKV